MSPSGPQSSSWFKDIFLPVGSVLIGFLGLAAQFTLPQWMLLLAAAYLSVAGIMAVLFLCQRAAPRFVQLRMKCRTRSLARINFPELLQTLQDFQKLIVPQNSNTLIYVLTLGPQYNQTAGAFLPADPEHIDAVRNWAVGIEERARLLKPRDFLQLSKELSVLIQEYNHFLCRRVPRLQTFIDQSGVDQGRLREIKQRWSLSREAHMSVIKRWEPIAEKINKAVGTRACIDYYESLGTLE